MCILEQNWIVYQIRWSLIIAVWLQKSAIFALAVISETNQYDCSKPGRSANILRCFLNSHRRVYEHYFYASGEIRDKDSGAYGPLHNSHHLECRFCVLRAIFDRLLLGTVTYSEYLCAGLRKDVAGKYGTSPLKITVSSSRYLMYGNPADSIDEYCALGDSTAYCH